MLAIEKAFIDYFVRLIDEVRPIAGGANGGANGGDKLLIKDVETNEAKSITITDLLGFVDLNGTNGRIVRYASTGQTESVLLEDDLGIAIDEAKYIMSSAGQVIIDFGAEGSEIFSFSRDGVDGSDLPLYDTSWIYGRDSDLQIGFSNTSIGTFDDNSITLRSESVDATSTIQINKVGFIDLLVSDGLVASNIAVSISYLTLGQLNHTQIELKDNSNLVSTSGDVDKYSSFIGSKNSTMAIGVINSVVIGGNGLYAKSSNTAYVNQIGYSTSSGANQTLITFDNPTGARFITFPDQTGNVILTSGGTFDGVVNFDAGLDVTATGASDTLLIGTVNANEIIIGSAGNDIRLVGDIFLSNGTNTIDLAYTLSTDRSYDLPDLSGTIIVGNIENGDFANRDNTKALNIKIGADTYRVGLFTF